MATKSFEEGFEMFNSDKPIGEVLKQIRRSSGISQMELADRISVSYQQMQKYENGLTKLSLFRLKQISGALGVPPIHFLENGLPGSGGQESVEGTGLSREDARLLLLFRKIENKKMKKKFLKILENMVKMSSAGKSNKSSAGSMPRNSVDLA